MSKYWLVIILGIAREKNKTRSSGFGQPQLNVVKHNGLRNGSGGILIMAVCES